MTQDEFKELKALCKTRTTHVTVLPNGHSLEVGQGFDGWCYYAVETDIQGNLVRPAGDHPRAAEIIRQSGFKYGDA